MSDVDVKVVLNKKNIRDLLLKGEGTKKMIDDLAKGIANRAGEGYEYDSYVGRNRVNTSVRTKSLDAVQDNAENNTLLKSLK